MNKAICLALLAVLSAGQAHAVRGADPSKANVNQSRETMVNANKSVERLALEGKIRDYSARVRGSKAGAQLSPTAQRELVKNMIRDAQIKEVADRILADSTTDSEAMSLNSIALETLSVRKVSSAIDAVAGPDAAVAKESEVALTDALLEAKGWKDKEQIKNLKQFAGNFILEKGKGKSESQAMESASKNMQEVGITIDWKKIAQLCKRKA